MSISQIRTKCAAELNKYIKNKKYSQNLETQIWHYASSPDTIEALRLCYYQKYNQLLFNLKLTPELTKKYTPSQLVILDNEILNTNSKKTLTVFKEQMDRYQKVLEDFNDGTEDVEGGLECPKCKNRNGIRVIAKQTRSADEPMTMFCTCSKCKREWKMY